MDVERREFPFPCGLEDRLAAVANAINTELKSAVMIHLDDVLCEAREIRTRIRESVGEGSYLPITKTFQNYCHNTLVTIGCVVEESIRRETVESVSLAYRLSKAGERYGRPIAALALEYAAEKGMSLFQVLGSTHSTGERRAPFSRIRILEYLHKHRNVSNREVDLVCETGLGGSTILSALRDLSKIGFVEYDSAGECLGGKGVIVYHWVPGNKIEDVRMVKTYRTLTKEAAQLLKDRGSITSTEAAQCLKKNSGHFSNIYSGLVLQGFAKREKGFLGAQKLSDVRIKEEANDFLQLLGLMKEILSDRLSEQNRRQIYDDFIHGGDYQEILRSALACYVKISRNIHCKPRDDTINEIVRLLKNNPGMRPDEIMKRLGCQRTSYFSELVRKGTLRKKRNGKEVKYYVVE